MKKIPLAEQYLNLTGKINEELPPKMKTVLERLDKMSTQKKAELYKSLFMMALSNIEDESIANRLLKELSQQAYTLVIGKDSTAGGTSYTFTKDEVPEVGSILDNGAMKIAVLLKSKGKNDFYYTMLDDNGNLEKKPRVFHSNMLDKGEEFSVADDKIKGVEDSYKKYTWFDVSDDDDLVNAEMAQHSDDGRYQLFMDEAPEELKKLYKENERDNHHTNNGLMILSFVEAKQAGEEIDIEQFLQDFN